VTRPAVDAEVIAALRGFSERRLTPAEVTAALAVPIAREEAAEVLALSAWFCRRYPTAAERLAYVRRAYRRWKARSIALAPRA
jgi:hypothetical protein